MSYLIEPRDIVDLQKSFDSLNSWKKNIWMQLREVPKGQIDFSFNFLHVPGITSKTSSNVQVCQIKTSSKRFSLNRLLLQFNLIIFVCAHERSLKFTRFWLIRFAGQSHLEAKALSCLISISKELNWDSESFLPIRIWKLIQISAGLPMIANVCVCSSICIFIK